MAEKIKRLQIITTYEIIFTGAELRALVIEAAWNKVASILPEGQELRMPPPSILFDGDTFNTPSVNVTWRADSIEEKNYDD